MTVVLEWSANYSRAGLFGADYGLVEVALTSVFQTYKLRTGFRIILGRVIVSNYVSCA